MKYKGWQTVMTYLKKAMATDISNAGNYSGLLMGSQGPVIIYGWERRSQKWGCGEISSALFSQQLKADRPHPRNYPHTPTDDRHTYQRFSRERGDRRTDRRTDGRTDGRTLPSTLSPSLRGR